MLKPLMLRTIYLARHGETDWNREKRWQGHTDICLNDAGRQQAEELAHALIGHGIQRAYSSDLCRARETAEIVARVLGLEGVLVDSGLRERCFGVFEGLTEGQCVERYPEHWAGYRSNHRRPPPGAEDPTAVALRVRQALDRIVASLDEPQAPVLLVSHGGAIRSFLLAETGELPPPLGNGALFRLKVGSGSLRDVERLR
jgi:probable phosphoglycerate mutase